MTRPITEREKLEPCPFCGSPFAELKQYEADPGLWWRVECASCCAKSQGAKYPAVASASWNRRAPSAAVRGMREALEDATKQLNVVLMWIDNWDPNFVQEDEWKGDRCLANAAMAKARAALSGIEGEDEQARSPSALSASTDRL